LAWALLVWAALKLWPEVVFLSLSLLLAIALNPLVETLHRRRVPRRVSVVALAVVLVVVICLFAVFVLPPLIRQAADVVANFPAFQARIEKRLPSSDPALRKVVSQMFLLPSSPEVAAHLNKPLIWGELAVSGIMTTAVVLITTLYLLLDGKRVYAWLLAYVPREHREKMAQMVPDVSSVVHGYVRGQLFTSVLFGVFSVVVLALLRVPAAIPLAVFAAVCDVVPVAGIILATAPAALLALTVSPVVALSVLVSYTLYHLFEAYVIVPRVYGNTLRLPTLAVLLALIAGGALQGILGAVIVLPLVAAYPIIERIWLKGYLGPHVLHDHRALARAAETGRESAVEAVLQGEKHPDEPPSRRRPPTSS
jgi:predicted PurR-regulated permease PerM